MTRTNLLKAIDYLDILSDDIPLRVQAKRRLREALGKMGSFDQKRMNKMVTAMMQNVVDEADLSGRLAVLELWAKGTE